MRGPGSEPGEESKAQIPLYTNFCLVNPLTFDISDFASFFCTNEHMLFHMLSHNVGQKNIHVD